MCGTYALAALAVGVITSLSVTPSAAKDYPYCLQGDRFSVLPGDCSFETFAQCKATASGQRGDCNINPRLALGQQNNGDRRSVSRSQRVYRTDVSEGYDFPPRF